MSPFVLGILPWSLNKEKKSNSFQILFKLYNFQVHKRQMKDWTAAIIRDLVATSAFFLLFFPQLAGFFCFFILVEIFMHTEENYVPVSGIFLKEVNPVSPNSP